MKIMRPLILATLAVVALVFVHPEGAWAVGLTNTVLTDAQFDVFCGMPIEGTIRSSNFTVGSTTAGTIQSVVYAGEGLASGYFIYTYQVIVTTGSAVGVSFDFGAIGNITPNLNLDSLPGSDDSFFITGALAPGGPLAGVYNSNGLLAPVSSAVLGSGLYETLFPTVTPGNTSAIFGVISHVNPHEVTANLLVSGGLQTTDLPTVPSPVPEPATLLLLGSGLMSLAALGWRRRKAR